MTRTIISRPRWKVQRAAASRALHSGRAMVIAGGRRAFAKRGSVTISGAPDAVEDYLDAQEIDRRLADPANARRLSWDEIKARRGL